MSFLAPRSDVSARAKICGLTKEEDLAFCQSEGADAIGLNFWPKSKRYLNPDVAAKWLQHHPVTPTRIGVFVNEPLDSIRSLLDKGIIEIAQLHGNESPEDCASLRQAGYRVIKAIGVRDATSLNQLRNYEVDGVVLDAFCPGEYGGSGKTFNWELALEAKEILGQTPLILSGGIVAANVVAAIEQVRPFAVDVASGVESSPGIKCQSKITEFLQAARSA